MFTILTEPDGRRVGIDAALVISATSNGVLIHHPPNPAGVSTRFYPAWRSSVMSCQPTPTLRKSYAQRHD